MAWTFKKITETDLPILLTWFKEPHVQQWCPIPTQDEVLAHFLKRIRSKDTFGYLALLDGMPIGYIQYYYLDTSEAKTGAYLPVIFPKPPLAQINLSAIQIICIKDMARNLSKHLSIICALLNRISPPLSLIPNQPTLLQFAAMRRLVLNE